MFCGFLQCVLETEYNKRSYLTVLLYWIMSSDVSLMIKSHDPSLLVMFSSER